MRLILQNGFWVVHILFVEWSNYNFLHNYQWITFLNQPSQVLNSFSTKNLHSLIMWMVVLSLSPHKLHLLFWWVLSMFGLIYFCFLVIVVLLIIVLFVLFLVIVISLSVLFFYIVFELPYRCINALFSAGGSSFSFFSWHIQSVYVISEM